MWLGVPAENRLNAASRLGGDDGGHLLGGKLGSMSTGRIAKLKILTVAKAGSMEGKEEPGRLSE